MTRRRVWRQGGRDLTGFPPVSVTATGATMTGLPDEGPLRLGPFLRYAERGQATIWVETTRPCTVEVLTGLSIEPAASGATFTAFDHHYAIVTVDGLPTGRQVAYRIRLDGEDVWPWPGFPPSVIRIAGPDEDLRIAFGSCLAQGPQEPPWTVHRRHDKQGLGPDALRALALRVREDPTTRPDALLLLGDQVYADSAAPDLRQWIAERRSIEHPPYAGVANFMEYAELYNRTWSDPVVRWLLSTVPTSMVFDDHEIIDDWNTSASWVEDIRRQDWWDERITSGLAAYWIYEHLGNLSPDELATNETLAAVRAADDGAEVLRERAREWDRGTTGTQGARWSYRRRIGSTTVLVVDSRNGRVLEPGRRRMIDDAEFAWLAAEASGARGHLLIATSVPWLLPSGIHQVEGWNEAMADGAWGSTVAGWAEKLRRAIDLEHWAAFRASWEQLADLVRARVCGPVADGNDSVLVLSGDVHYSYAAELGFTEDVHRPVWQLTSSPLRYPTPSSLERAFTLATTVVGDAIGSVLAKVAGLDALPAHWDMKVGPLQDNGVAEVFLEGERARVTFSGAFGDDEPVLRPTAELTVA